MGCVLMAVAGKFDWESVRNLEMALYLCMICPDRETMVESWKGVVAAFGAVSAELNARSSDQLARERAQTRKAEADAVVAVRQTHNWFWRVFH
jgi:hypothetical protein